MLTNIQKHFKFIPAMLDNFLKLQNDQSKIIKKKTPWFKKKGKVLPIAKAYGKKDLFKVKNNYN